MHRPAPARMALMVVFVTTLVSLPHALADDNGGDGDTMDWDGTSTGTVTVQVTNDGTAAGPPDSLNNVTVSVTDINGQSVPSAVVSPQSQTIPFGMSGQFTVTISPSDLSNLSSVGGLVVQTNMDNTDVFEALPALGYVQVVNSPPAPIDWPFLVALAGCLLLIAFLSPRHRSGSAAAWALLMVISIAAAPRTVQSHGLNEGMLQRDFNLGNLGAFPNGCATAPGNQGMTILKGGPIKPKGGGVYGGLLPYKFSQNQFTGKTLEVSWTDSAANGCGIKQVRTTGGPVNASIGLFGLSIDMAIKNSIGATEAPCTLTYTQDFACRDPVARQWVPFATNTVIISVTAPPGGMVVTTVTNNDTNSSAAATTSFP